MGGKRRRSRAASRRDPAISTPGEKESTPEQQHTPDEKEAPDTELTIAPVFGNVAS